MTSPVARVQGLRSSGAAGPHQGRDHRVPLSVAEDIHEQLHHTDAEIRDALLSSDIDIDDIATRAKNLAPYEVYLDVLRLLTKIEEQERDIYHSENENADLQQQIRDLEEGDE